MITTLAVNVLILATEDGIESQLPFTSMAGGTFFVITPAFAGYGLRTEDGSLATGAILLGILGLDDTRVNQLVIDIRGTDLRPKFHLVAIFAVEISIRAVVIGQAVQKAGAVHATETILMIP